MLTVTPRVAPCDMPDLLSLHYTLTYQDCKHDDTAWHNDNTKKWSHFTISKHTRSKDTVTQRVTQTKQDHSEPTRHMVGFWFTVTHWALY